MTTHLPIPASIPPDSIVYSMSKSGYCVRAMVASQLDMPERRSAKTQDMLERTADEGRLHEQAIKDRLREEGYGVLGEQAEFVIPVIPSVYLVGHGDGFASKEPGPLVTSTPDPQHWDLLECKSMSQAQFAKWVRGGFAFFPGYAAQITSYMHANPGFRVRYAVKRREDGQMSTVFIAPNDPPLSFKAIRRKVVAAEMHRRRDEFPPCDLDKSGRFFCPFWYLHEEEDDEVDTTPLSEEAEVALAELVAVYVDLKAKESEGEAAGKERKEGGVNEGILNLMGDREKVLVTIGDRRFEITKRAGGGGSRLDIDALRAEEPEIAAKYERKQPRFEYPVVREVTER